MKTTEEINEDIHLRSLYNERMLNFRRFADRIRRAEANGWERCFPYEGLRVIGEIPAWFNTERPGSGYVYDAANLPEYPRTAREYLWLFFPILAALGCAAEIYVYCVGGAISIWSPLGNLAWIALASILYIDRRENY